MNAQFERSENNQEWYTPKYIIEALTKDTLFDLDPCAGEETNIARENWTQRDGYKHPWNGRVFLNPPYKHPVVEKFVRAMVHHNNGTALLFNRYDSVLWQDLIFPTASALFFLKGRIKFINRQGLEGGTPGTGSALVAWGYVDADILERVQLPGTFIRLR